MVRTQVIEMTAALDDLQATSESLAWFLSSTRSSDLAITDHETDMKGHMTCRSGAWAGTALR